MTELRENPLRVAIVRFPGSNCDFDAIRFFHRFGHKAEFLWHKETEAPNADLLVLPGGFAFGDRKYQKATHSFTIEPGVQALESPVMKAVHRWAEDGKPILGICNGFQILTHAGLLPGRLVQNESGRFFCDDVDCRVEGASFFNDTRMVDSIHRINIAHGYGNYQVGSFDKYDELIANDQIFLRYHGLNPNGSLGDIAGVCNLDKTIFGMMPHPERADFDTQRTFMEAIENYVQR